jgi:hypothetical protein
LIQCVVRILDLRIDIGDIDEVSHIDVQYGGVLEGGYRTGDGGRIEWDTVRYNLSVKERSKVLVM